MIKLFDYLYYYVYQLNRKGYKKDTHDYARGFLASIFAIWGSISIFFFDLFIAKFYRLDGILLALLFAIPIYIAVFYYSGKSYGINGSRAGIVKEFDKKYSLKKQNRYYQSFVIWVLTILWMAFCVVMRFKFIKWFDL